MSDQATRSDEPARWLVEEHDDGVHQVTRYVRVFDTPVQRVYGFIQRARFLLGSLQLLFAFNKDLLIQAPWCFCAIALSKAAMALQGAAKVYVTGTLMRQTQQYLQGNREEYEMLPVLSAVLLVGMVPGLVRKFTLWPRGRIAMLVNISIDERLMAGFSKLNEEDREREQIKDMVNEASKLYIREHGGGGPMRGLLGAEEVFGLASKIAGVPLRLWAIFKLVESARTLVMVLALFTLFEDRLFLSTAKRLWSRASNTISLTSKLQVRLQRLSEIMTSPHYLSDVQVLGLSPWLSREHTSTAAQIRQSDASLIGMRRFEIRHEGQRELHIALRHIFIAAILLGYTARARRTGQETLSIASWTLIQQSAQDLSREVGSVQRDYHRLYNHCRQLVALDTFEKTQRSKPAASTQENKIDGHSEAVIQFSNVSFRYPRRHEKVLDGVSFTVRPNSMVALVGLNGSGKSTVAKLLSGAYRLPPDFGTLHVQGKDVSSVSTDELTELVTTLPQKPILLPMSIRDNIALGCQDDAAIEEVARKSGAIDFIMGHPDGFNALLAPPAIKGGRHHGDDFHLFKEGDSVQISTFKRSSRSQVQVHASLQAQAAQDLSERVTHHWQPPRMPSGGETQRIAIARALLKGGPILVLDEPTNNLDSHGTHQVLQTIRELKGTRTLIVIAHYWPGITDIADQVILMDKGKVVQMGHHHELLQQADSPYAKLWNLQMAGQPLEPRQPNKEGGRPKPNKPKKREEK